MPSMAGGGCSACAASPAVSAQVYLGLRMASGTDNWRRPASGPTSVHDSRDGSPVSTARVQFLKAFANSQKNTIDAEAIAEATTRPTMRFTQVRAALGL